LRRVDVGVGRHDVEVSGQHHGRIENAKLGSVLQEPLHPSKLVVEFRARLRVAVRRVSVAIKTPPTAASK